ncbi:MAG: hypothetical protein HRU82_02540 [Nitrospira sp.]|nr:MAG: hypothetical protein HRU82_02540 [Nitrospira sp.]
MMRQLLSVLLLFAAPLSAYGLSGHLGVGLGGGLTFPAGGGGGGGGYEETLLTDTDTHTEPTLPTLGAAGTKITDPTFGTTILRVTDATTEPDTGGHKGVLNSYSTQQAFNSDSSRVLFLVRDGYTRARFFDFNPSACTVNTTGYLLSSAPAGLQEYGMTWSATDPNKIYGVGNYNLYEITVPSGSSTTLKTFTGLGHTGGYVTQMNMSDDADVFAMRFEGGTGNGYVFWKRSTNTVLMSAASVANLDEVEVDKSGQYGIIVYTSGNGAEVWDLTAGPTQVGSDLTGNNAFNHRDTGSGGVFTHRPANTSLGYRSLATPTTITDLLPSMTNGWSYSSTQDHFSMQGANDLWALASRYKSDGSSVTKAFDNEIMQVATDGSGRVRRIAHHRSVFNEYYDSPFASISRDGKFVNFSSNWGSASGRHDGFIVCIQEAPTT